MPLSEWAVIARMSAFVVSSSIPQPALQGCVGAYIFVCVFNSDRETDTQTSFGFIVYIGGICLVSVEGGSPCMLFNQIEFALLIPNTPGQHDHYRVWWVFIGIVLAVSAVLRLNRRALCFPPLCREAVLESPPRSFNCSLGSMMARSREYGSPRWRPRIIMKQMMTFEKTVNFPSLY